MDAIVNMPKNMPKLSDSFPRHLDIFEFDNNGIVVRINRNHMLLDL